MSYEITPRDSTPSQVETVLSEETLRIVQAQGITIEPDIAMIEEIAHRAKVVPSDQPLPPTFLVLRANGDIHHPKRNSDPSGVYYWLSELSEAEPSPVPLAARLQAAQRIRALHFTEVTINNWGTDKAAIQQRIGALAQGLRTNITPVTLFEAQTVGQQVVDELKYPFSSTGVKETMFTYALDLGFTRRIARGLRDPFGVTKSPDIRRTSRG